MAFKLSFDPSIYERMPRVQEIPFDSERKLMTTVNKVNDKFIVYTKGGIDELLEKCSSYQISGEIKQDTQSFKKYHSIIENVNEKMAKEALRVLGCAYKIIESRTNKRRNERYRKQFNLSRNGRNDRPTKRRSQNSSRKM